MDSFLIDDPSYLLFVNEKIKNLMSEWTFMSNNTCYFPMAGFTLMFGAPELEMLGGMKVMIKTSLTAFPSEIDISRTMVFAILYFCIRSYKLVHFNKVISFHASARNFRNSGHSSLANWRNDEEVIESTSSK